MQPIDRIQITKYFREDGSIVVHVDTPGISENRDGPILTVYLNDDIESPLWDNREDSKCSTS